ncbi:MAG: hypothetical protein JWP03_4694, partial [Phycisphaerales bacterium]|nr:hypothetical protein [Phycisphaerales bacterium]
EIRKGPIVIQIGETQIERIYNRNGLFTIWAIFQLGGDLSDVATPGECAPSHRGKNEQDG